MIDIQAIANKVESGEIVSTAPELEDGLTAYQIAKLLNETYKAVGIDKTVPPQYVYNLSRNGRIDGVKGTGNRRYDEETVTKFIEKMVARNLQA